MVATRSRKAPTVLRHPGFLQKRDILPGVVGTALGCPA